ncbi:MAG: hypothetical protein J0I25_06515, partial [Sphingomonadales bacterium]|nr:hypothetical protein [Sphingomonadales bacterium]
MSGSSDLSRRTVLMGAGGAVAAASAATAIAAPAATAAPGTPSRGRRTDGRYNILLIVTDQQR